MENSNLNKFSNLLETTNTITESFKRLKFVTILSLAFAAATAAVCVVYSLNKFTEMKRHVYVIDKGQVMTASSQDIAVSLRDRIEFQSKNLHKLLFTITPNSDIVKDNLEQALQISDRSVYNYYKDLNEKKFYSRMYQTNSSQDIFIDSVKVNTSRQPYQVATYCTLLTIRETTIQRSLLMTRCDMIEVNMNYKNREGLQVERFEVLRNDVIETRRRN